MRIDKWWQKQSAEFQTIGITIGWILFSVVIMGLVFLICEADKIINP